jgi:acetyltransferase-like isoleucine patch superfamily enzyme
MISQFIFNILQNWHRGQTWLLSEFVYRPICGRWGKNTRIQAPLLFLNPSRFCFGDRVFVRAGARLEAVVNCLGDKFNPSVEIGSGTNIEQGFHLACAERITIGRNVQITENVGIFDIWHPYLDITLPIKCQPLKTAPVSIGDDSFIGMGAVIQPGVSIGRHCLIGANSVVTENIPDFAVAVGAPARVIRRYDFGAQRWITP